LHGLPTDQGEALLDGSVQNLDGQVVRVARMGVGVAKDDPCRGTGNPQDFG
jgi:hypothetical protein